VTRSSESLPPLLGLAHRTGWHLIRLAYTPTTMSTSYRESVLTGWSKGPSPTESEKCENAERIVKDALAAWPSLQEFEYRVFAQGSYRARTNTRLNSDVDICVCQTDQFQYDLPSSGSQLPGDYGITTVFSNYARFKDAVGQALQYRFGANGVHRGNKAWDIHENSYRIDADVVAAKIYRRYDNLYTLHEGIIFWSDSGHEIINYPEQTYENGVRKNDATSRMYKRAVRILKRCRDRLQEANIGASQGIGSFLIESLVWNSSDWYFDHPTYHEAVDSVLRDLIDSTNAEALCKHWGEVNDLKYLFGQHQPWTRSQAFHFLRACKQYIDNL
jgi:hypothetical protein